MKVLVINSGSSSLKYQLFDMNGEKVIAKGNCEKIGAKDSFVVYKVNGKEYKFDEFFPTHSEAMNKVLSVLTDKEIGVLKSLDEVEAFGHRVLHGGEIYKDSVIVDDKVLANLEELKPLGPLHMPANIAGIKSCMALCKGKPNIAVFDTAFHQTMPDYAYMYGLPYRDYEEFKIRKYGFHGTSHKYVSGELAKLTNKPIEQTRFITVHLGNGSSLCAEKGGKSVDTSMGFTPLEGLVMGTRCGDIDASVLEYLSEKTGMTLKELTVYMNKKSGVLGINGVSGDMRDNDELIKQGNKRAVLAQNMICYRVKKYIGSYAAAMGGVDAIAFTGGVGENSKEIREECLQGLEFMGIKLDKNKNDNLARGVIGEISTDDSKVKVYRIPTNEELVIARDCVRLTK